jgi:hypothetical protein
MKAAAVDTQTLLIHNHSTEMPTRALLLIRAWIASFNHYQSLLTEFLRVKADADGPG